MSDPAYITPEELIWLKERIKCNDVHAFYTWSKWLKVRKQVLAHDKECQSCKAKGRYSKAVIVHHIKHLREFPEHSLSMWIETDGAPIRQLISLCPECHELEHPEMLRRYKPESFITKERWD